jgi:hypothetical protein
MGDRNSIKITYSNGESIYLYGHWIGNETVDIVRDALANSGRVSDESYFARILFSRMIERDIHGETGFGIAPYMVDHDAGNQLVHINYSVSGNGPEIDWNMEVE